MGFLARLIKSCWESSHKLCPFIFWAWYVKFLVDGKQSKKRRKKKKEKKKEKKEEREGCGVVFSM